MQGISSAMRHTASCLQAHSPTMVFLTAIMWAGLGLRKPCAAKVGSIVRTIFMERLESFNNSDLWQSHTANEPHVIMYDDHLLNAFRLESCFAVLTLFHFEAQRVRVYWALASGCRNHASIKVPQPSKAEASGTMRNCVHIWGVFFATVLAAIW